MKFTVIIEKSEDGWYVGQFEEFPAAMSQGKTIGHTVCMTVEQLCSDDSYVPSN